jgi:hypothetical protein
LHYTEVHKESILLNNFWLAGKYYELGFEGGAYGHKIFKISTTSQPNLSDKDILQQGLNGIFE